MKIIVGLLTAFLLLPLMTCGSHTKFLGDSRNGRIDDKVKGDGDGDAVGNEETQNGNNGDSSGNQLESSLNEREDEDRSETSKPTLPEEDSPISADEKCPALSQNILIIDLKSGWWAGDGGKFFQTVLGGLTDPCISTVKIEYHHITASLHEKKIFPTTGNSSSTDKSFGYENFNNYSQIWFLSGAEDDPEDLSINSTTFVSIMNKISNSTSPLFLGAGYGAVYHTNALGKALKYNGALLSQKQGGGVFFPHPMGVNVHSYVQIDVPGHALFRDVNKVADVISNPALTNIIYLESDHIQHPSFSILAHCSKGRATLGVHTLGQRKIVIDAGLQRYYAITKPAGSDTLHLLRNIMVYLSK